MVGIEFSRHVSLPNYADAIREVPLTGRSPLVTCHESQSKIGTRQASHDGAFVQLRFLREDEIHFLLDVGRRETLENRCNARIKILLGVVAYLKYSGDDARNNHDNYAQNCQPVLPDARAPDQKIPSAQVVFSARRKTFGLHARPILGIGVLDRVRLDWLWLFVEHVSFA